MHCRLADLCTNSRSFLFSFLQSLNVGVTQLEGAGLTNTDMTSESYSNGRPVVNSKDVHASASGMESALDEVQTVTSSATSQPEVQVLKIYSPWRPVDGTADEWGGTSASPWAYGTHGTNGTNSTNGTEHTVGQVQLLLPDADAGERDIMRATAAFSTQADPATIKSAIVEALGAKCEWQNGTGENIVGTPSAVVSRVQFEDIGSHIDSYCGLGALRIERGVPGISPQLTCKGKMGGCKNIGEDDGDCDVDSDCAGSLVCGTNNCKHVESTPGWAGGASTDCCVPAGGNVNQQLLWAGNQPMNEAR
jgi:hypothetical protein